MADAQVRDPKLDKCDEEIMSVLKKYGKVIRPMPFIDAEGRIGAQIIYFDTPTPTADGKEPSVPDFKDTTTPPSASAGQLAKP